MSREQLIPNYQILDSIAMGDDETAKTLIEASPDAPRGKFMCWSIEARNKNMVRYLLESPRGYDVEANIFCDYTPLTMAINMNNTDIVRILLDAGADPDGPNYRHNALKVVLRASHIFDAIVRLILGSLSEKCGGDRAKIAERLIEARCRIDQAALLRDAGVIDRMLNKGVPINSSYWLNIDSPCDPRVGKRTALHVAASLDDVDTVKLLVERGGDLYLARDDENATALNYVYKNNSKHNDDKVEILRILLGLGLSMTSCTSIGEFQVGPTLSKGDYAAVRVLLQAGIDFAARDHSREECVLHCLAANKHTGVARELKPYVGRFDVNARSRFGVSPLHYAASLGNAEMLRFLLEQGAEVDSTNALPPLFHAYLGWRSRYGKRYGQCVKLLLQHGADPQFVADRSYVRKTMFDVALGERRLRSVIAQLALSERLGKEISDPIRDKINAREFRREYLKKCGRMLGERVAGDVTVYDLLTCNKKRLTGYVKREKSLRKAKHLKDAKKIKTEFSYYYDSIKKRLSENTRYMELQVPVRAVLCELFEGRVDPSNMIIDKLVDYLDDGSLQSLYEVGKSGGLLR